MSEEKENVHKKWEILDEDTKVMFRVDSPYNTISNEWIVKAHYNAVVTETTFFNSKKEAQEFYGKHKENKQ